MHKNEYHFLVQFNVLYYRYQFKILKCLIFFVSSIKCHLLYKNCLGNVYVRKTFYLQNDFYSVDNLYSVSSRVRLNAYLPLNHIQNCSELERIYLHNNHAKASMIRNTIAKERKEAPSLL